MMLCLQARRALRPAACVWRVLTRRGQVMAGQVEGQLCQSEAVLSLMRYFRHAACLVHVSV
jgi:hypothetical protein